MKRNSLVIHTFLFTIIIKKMRYWKQIGKDPNPKSVWSSWKYRLDNDN